MTSMQPIKPHGSMKTGPVDRPTRRMRKLPKGWWFWALMASGVIIALGFRLSHEPTDSFWTKGQQIRTGMTMEQVESIMGDEGMEDQERFGRIIFRGLIVDFDSYQWIDKDRILLVAFDKKNRVLAKYLSGDYHPSIFERLRAFFY
jgi:hypothetical protein